ncbi:DUF1694 domain-containing protein, partial [Streptococcus agalactiae]|nr:DUF1694 domain-containing protein [Streptococcus agalactiae]
NLSLKLSPNLPTDVQMFYMKLANRLSLAATIVNEANANSPFGIIIHSDKAENVEWNDFETQFPDLFNSPKKEESPKKSLWQHFFSQK